jgi:hypothetical protein
MKFEIGKDIYYVGFSRKTVKSVSGINTIETTCFIGKGIPGTNDVFEVFVSPVEGKVTQNYRDKDNGVIARKMAFTRAIKRWSREQRKEMWEIYKSHIRYIPGKKVEQTVKV